MPFTLSKSESKETIVFIPCVSIISKDTTSAKDKVPSYIKYFAIEFEQSFPEGWITSLVSTM